MNTIHLNTRPNFGIPGERYRHPYLPGDAFYDRLVSAHRDLSDAQSEMLNARLVLLLANHIGALRVVAVASAIPRDGVEQVRP